jgi:hypothetical protein
MTARYIINLAFWLFFINLEINVIYINMTIIDPVRPCDLRALTFLALKVFEPARLNFVRQFGKGLEAGWAW